MAKIASILCISIFVLTLYCYTAESQNLRDLSYGGEVYAPPISTSTAQPSSTTKKSSFFGGIKKLFSRSSTTTEAPVSQSSTPPTGHSVNTPVPTPASPSNSQGETNRDYVNQNINSGNGGSSLSQGSSSPQNPNQINSAVTPTPPPRRDYVNPNPSKPQTPTLAPTSSHGPYPQNPNQVNNVVTPTPPPRRDYVNPNPSKPQTPTPSQGPSSPQSPSIVPPTPPPRRNYVNPNPSRPQAPTLAPISSISTPTSQPQMNYNSGHRDYVNPNSPFSSPTPKSPFTDSRGQSINRDYVNPGTPPSTIQGTSTSVPGASSPTNNRRDYINPTINKNNVPSPTSHTVLKPEDFPPLPTPRSPGSIVPQSHRGQYPTRQPSITTSTQKTSELATDEELTTLSETLFSKDTNNQNKNVIVNLQGQTRSSETNDQAPQPLLQIQDEAFQTPTISKMRLLYNNYEMDTTVNEYVTPMERQEENDFVDAVLKTQVMRQAMLFLQDKGIVTPDPRTHKDLLKTIWFTMYSRGGGRIGSSAFEHVFLNEIKNGTITGLHNWIYFYEEERQGHIDYKGYIKKVDLGNKGAIVKYRFDYNGISKPVNVMFIGTSPELEMALYTVCFQVRPDKDCPITVNGNKFNMKTYTFRYRGKNLIGSAFPEI